MKNMFQKRLNVVLAMVAVNFLGACAPSAPSAMHESSAATAMRKPAQAKQGGSNSGGGTGVAGAVWENYIDIDVTKRPEFIQYLEPLFANVVDTSDPSTDVGIEIKQYFKFKPWYFVPEKLERLRGTQVGMKFLDEKSLQQFARQDLTKIVIDLNEYQAMSSDEKRAELLMHEFVETLYLWKFTSYDTVLNRAVALGLGSKAKASLTNDRLNSFLEAFRSMDEMYPPEPVRDLNPSDYDKIEYVTKTLLTRMKSKITQAEFTAILDANGFDKRFFNSQNYSESSEAEAKSKKVELAKNEFLDSIQSVNFMGEPISECTASETKQVKPCTLNINPVIRQLSAMMNGSLQVYQSPMLEVSIVIQGESPIQFDIPFDTKMHTLNSISRSQPDKSTKKIYQTGLLSYSAKVAKGDRIYLISFNFEQIPLQGDRIRLKLSQAELMTNVVYSIDKARDPKCLAAPLSGDEFISSSIIMSKKGKRPTPLELVNAKAWKKLDFARCFDWQLE